MIVLIINVHLSEGPYKMHGYCPYGPQGLFGHQGSGSIGIWDTELGQDWLGSKLGETSTFATESHKVLQGCFCDFCDMSQKAITTICEWCQITI